jgi:putative ABC transport system ATP-binding protein
MSVRRETSQTLICLQRGENLLKFPINAKEYRLGRDPKWSSFPIPSFGWEALSRRHAIFQKEGEHYRLLDGDGNRPSRNGTFMGLTRIDHREGILLKPRTEIWFGQNSSNQVRLTYLRKDSFSKISPLQRIQPINLKMIQKWPVILGRVQANHGTTLLLEAPNVSRYHASISKDALGNYILQDNSTNGTIINQLRIEDSIQLQDRDVITIGPYQLKFQNSSLSIFSSLEDAW